MRFFPHYSRNRDGWCRRLARKARWRNWPACAIAWAIALGTAGCDRTPAAPEAKKPKVKVAYPLIQTVMDYQDFTGRLEAVKTIEIRARVSGYVTQVPFKEGERVRDGDLLFQIDERPYQADLNQAEANLKVAEADHNLQIRNAERARNLLPANAISKEDYETVVAAREKSAATVGSAKAAKERAELYLTYTKVTAPVTGRVSRRFIDPGNLINADATVLTTVVTEDPMYAYFDVDERTYLDLLGAVAPGQKSWYEGLKLPVMMRLANESEFDRVGVVDFVDNRIIANTGTVRMRGVFENPSGLLKSGLFLRVRLPIGSAYKAIVIPDEAILSDQERKYVWLVNDQGEVVYRSVKLGQSVQDWRVIRPAPAGKEGKEGLSTSERIVTSGMQRVRNGTRVDAETESRTPPPEMPLVGLWTRSRAAGPTE